MTGKRRWAYAALLISLSFSVAAVALDSQYRAYARGWENATENTFPLPNRLPLAGVNVELTQYSDQELHEHLQALSALGIVWIRQFFPWAEIEATPGQYAWESWDRVVGVVNQYDSLQLVAVLHTSPEWARHADAPEMVTAPPADVADFGTFASLFASRYGEVIDYYQIWDEPNLGGAWGNLPPNPVYYAALLQAGYKAIHATDSTATVIAAALAPTTELGPHNISDPLFLNDLYIAGAAQYFDAAAGKPYGFDSAPYDRRVNESILNYSRIILLREVMLQHNDGAKALWACAFGWNALPSEWSGRPSIWGNVSRVSQQDFIEAAYNRAATEWPWLGGLILQHWQPAVSQDDPLWGFALVRPGETPIQVQSKLFGIANSYAALPGRYPVRSAFATYSGEWEFGDLGADIGYLQDSTFSFLFQASDIALELRRANYRGYLYVTVDNKPANALPRDANGESYVILNAADNLARIDVVPIATGLNPSEIHVLQAHAEYGWDQWALVGFRAGTPLSGWKEHFLVPVFAVVAALSGFGFLYLVLNGAMAGVLWRLPRHLDETRHLLAGVITSVLLMVGMALTWNDGLPNLLRRDPPGIIAGLLTSGLLYLSDSLILTLVAGLLLWILIYNRVEIGLILTILWLPFFLYPVSLHQFAVPVAEVCILLTTLAWALQGSVVRARLHTPISIKAFLRELGYLDWGVMALFVVATLSLIWAEYPVVALREWRTMLLEPALFYWIVRTTIHTRGEIVRLTGALIASGAVAALVGLLMFLSGEGVVLAEGATRRLAGVYGSPNNVGLYMGRTLPFALAFAVWKGSLQRRVFAGIAVCLIAIAAILSQSAGALLLGIPFSILLFLLVWDRRLALITMIVAGAGAILAFFPLSQHPRFARLLDFSEGTVFFRLRLWQSTWQMIKNRPLQGYGLDQFLYQYRGRYILPDAWQEPNLSHPHNILLDFWTRLGLAGVAILLWLQYSFWRTTTRLLQQLSRNDALWYVTVACMASMADLIGHGLVDNSVFVIDLSFVFVFLLILPVLITHVVAADAHHEG